MFPKPPTHPVWPNRLHGMLMSPTFDTTFDRSAELTNLQDVIRDVQSKELYKNAKLTPLYIYRTNLSKSFENQVLARSAPN